MSPSRFSNRRGGGGGGGSGGCCGGGAACGYIHCAALGQDQSGDSSGCVQPWAMPNGMTEADCSPNVLPPAPAPATCSGCCPAGMACFVPDPPCCADQAPAPAPAPVACTQGQDCGGQVFNSCGTSCPNMCGTPPAMMCNMMCNSAFQCTGQDCFNSATGRCEAGGDGGGNQLPPGMAVGRPFLTAKLAPTVASPHEVVSDWAIEL